MKKLSRQITFFGTTFGVIVRMCEKFEINSGTQSLSQGSRRAAPQTDGQPVARHNRATSFSITAETSGLLSPSRPCKGGLNKLNQYEITWKRENVCGADLMAFVKQTSAEVRPEEASSSSHEDPQERVPLGLVELGRELVLG